MRPSMGHSCRSRNESHHETSYLEMMIAGNLGSLYMNTYMYINFPMKESDAFLSSINICNYYSNITKEWLKDIIASGC